jgi:hypothetical protein
MYQESFDLYLSYQLINRVFVNHLTLYVSSSFDLNEGRQKIKVGQTFLSGKAINSEIIIDDIAVVDDKTDDTILGEVRNMIFKISYMI